MDTKTVLKNFHVKGGEEIKSLIMQFLDEEFFVTFPELEGIVSVAITGSVASGYQDEKSDIDLAVFFKDRMIYEKYKFLILDTYRDDNKFSKVAPIEFHGGNIEVFESLEENLKSWKKDWLLREISDAVIICDSNDDLRKLQEKYVWYPKEVYREKLNGLFAEVTFLIFDRYEVGMNRGSVYYAESVKIRIIKLFLIISILLGKKYPKSEKHLEKDIKNFGKVSANEMKYIKNILTERESKKVFLNLDFLRGGVENMLIENGVIQRKNKEYWLGVRSSYGVNLGE